MRLLTAARDAHLTYRAYYRPLPLRHRGGAMARTLLMYLFDLQDAPMSLLLAITGRCQCDCRHCGVPYLGSGSKLDPGRVREILDEFRRLGGVRVVFSGGEPLLEESLPRMVGHAAGLGLIALVDTNGIALTPGLARELKRRGLAGLELSVDSLAPGWMDRNRRHPGALSRVLRAIEICRGEGIGFVVNTVAFRESLEGELDRVISYARWAGATMVRVLEPVATGRMEGRTEVALDEEGRRRYLNYYEPGFVTLEQVGRFTNSCSGLDGRYLSVAPDGTVTPCPYMPVPVGNINQESLRSAIEATRRLAESVRERCGCEGRECPVNDHSFRAAFLGGGDG